MAQLKKIIALSVLKGISILGLLFGFSCVLGLFMMVYYISSEDTDLAFLCIELITSVTLLAIGAWLTYDCYRMLRGRSFAAIHSIPAVLAFFTFGSVVEPIDRFASQWVNGIQAKTLVGLASFFAALFLSVLVYLICVKLLKRLVEVAYGSEKNSRTQNPEPEHEKLARGTAT